MVGQVVALVAEVLGGRAAARVRSLLGVGVALPGPLDHVHGVLHRVTGIPEWDGFPLRDVLGGRLGGCRWWSTRTPTPPHCGSPSRAGPGPSRICTSRRGSAAGW
ncbi:hypothetical protein GCM10020295_52190 [Streptomyces cinereospinus]